MRLLLAAPLVALLLSAACSHAPSAPSPAPPSPPPAQAPASSSAPRAPPQHPAQVPPPRPIAPMVPAPPMTEEAQRAAALSRCVDRGFTREWCEERMREVYSVPVGPR